MGTKNGNTLWGEMNESKLSVPELFHLTELCSRGTTERRITYLVSLYNDRSQELSQIEAHFVARYATKRGYILTKKDERMIFKKG